MAFAETKEGAIGKEDPIQLSQLDQTNDGE
jgi:hypothetical protein